MDSEEGNGASQHPCSSDVALRKIEEFERRLNILEGKMPLMVTNTVRQEIKPAVREEFQKLLTEGTRNEVAEERSLYLKFLDEVSGPVQTSKEFRAVTDGPLKVALFDATGNIVNSGPESSAEVEILLIDATGNGKECATTNEDFERTIIRTGDKKKPHFAKNVYVNLDNGVGSLTNQKLGQGSDWTKNWTCRLVARFVKNFGGLKVQKAWTSPFKVIDNRGEYDGMNGVQPRTLSEIFEADPNDMDPVQLNGGCQTSYEYIEAWIEELQFVDEYIHIEMSDGDDERAAAAVVNASIRWKQLFCVVTWTFSSSRRVSVNVGHPPKRKKQRVG